MKISYNQDLRMQLHQVTIFCQAKMARYISIGHENEYVSWDIYAQDIITHIIAPLLFTSDHDFDPSKQNIDLCEQSY